MQFSANLGFLWQDLSLPDAIRTAAKAGFDAVECHWPYEHDAHEVKAALDEAGLPMLGLNTRRGDVEAGDNGLAAIPSRTTEARAAIDEAVAYAVIIGAANIHVMAGYAKGDEAEKCFIDNLHYACEKAAPFGIHILIEPLNHHDADGYFLTTTAKAREIIQCVNQPNLKLMFDCYHVQIMQGDLTRHLHDCLDIIGHIQFASVPKRGTPNEGEINYHHIFTYIKSLGYDAPLGAEYKPANGDSDASLGWMRQFGK